MTTKSSNPPPFSRFSRLGFGLGIKSSNIATSPRVRDSEKQGAVDDPWYIPYSGPYEPPREHFKRRKERDSWGDPIYGEDDEDDTALASLELHKRYGVEHNPRAEDDQLNRAVRASVDGHHDGTTRKQRDRTQSGISGRTGSSGTVDPSRASIGIQRRSTVSSSQRPPVPSYINPDVSGGVGESPMPPTHHRSSSKEANYTSIAGLFSFGGQGWNKPSRKLSRIGQQSSGVGLGIGHTAGSHRRSASSGSNNLSTRNLNLDHKNLGSKNDDDYYNSYYYSATIPSTPTAPTTRPSIITHSPSNAQLRTGKKSSSPSPSPISPSHHPYAYAFPTSRNLDGPQTAPLPHTSSIPHANSHASGSRFKHTEPPPKVTLTGPSNPSMRKPASADVAQSRFVIPRPAPAIRGLKQLKNSISTPDLRFQSSSTNSPTSRGKRLPPTIKGKDRWLSAETWCDALLFPRPRLKIKHEGAEQGYTGSGRIVSPPSSPVQRGIAEKETENGQAEQVVPSRVLAHSRSLVDLGGPKSSRQPLPDVTSRTAVAQPSAQAELHPPQDGSLTTERLPRPKSFALDDLALLSPVPSLARVLEEGQMLDSLRKEWQSKAAQSFQNKRTRTISRARSKSLTQKRGKDDPPPSNMDFLAARACLGNQLLTPVIAPYDPPFLQANSNGSGSVGKISHSHSSSLAKTASKSSKSQTHSRNDSWSRSALRVAKSATCGLTGTDISPDGFIDFSTERLPPLGGGIESALKREGTRVIRLPDPSQINVDNLGLSPDATPLTSNSPTPSGTGTWMSDVRVGIALTTPPLLDNATDLDTMRFPAHPYAQGGMYAYSNYVPASRPPERENEQRSIAEHAPSRPLDSIQQEKNFDPNTDDRLPLPVMSHPYAQYSSSRESYLSDERIVSHPRTDSDIPPPAKMWAQWSPGVVREVLPGEIQYSPFMSENGDEDMEASARNSRTILDTVGVGETLAYAVRPRASKDSGLGTSEDHAILEPNQPQRVPVKRSYRQPVQYDTTRPLYLPQAARKPSDPQSAHTFASSPLMHSSTPPPDLPRNESAWSNEVYVPRTTSTSPESPSPPISPHPLGNPDDLENFYDLFYRPNSKPAPARQSSGSSSASPSGSHRRRAGSGLTSLARQLNEEFEQMTNEREGSQYSRSSTMDLPGSISRRPTDSTLEFVFEETSQPASLSSTGGVSLIGRSTISAFHPSPVYIPEDVESSRASSPLELEEDDTELFRVGRVGSVSTPPTVSGDPRSSYMGQMSSESQHLHDGKQDNIPIVSQSRVNSGLQPPSADPTRSSYLTSSSASRMSGLSDFPAPPPRQMSLLSSYFDEALSQSEARASQNPSPELPPLPSSSSDDGQSRRLTFGGDKDAEDLIAALSSHSSHSSPDL